MAASRIPVTARLDALTEAADLTRGRQPDAVVDQAVTIADRARGRLSLAGERTVVALAGATGSGKSSLFNALLGTELAVAGVRRPTTAHPLAAVVGPDDADELLDWLDLHRRERIDRPDDAGLTGMVLLDLPDHDSTSTAHRSEVDRLVALVDVLVWVTDPQKYADAALHDDYLGPLARHAEVMVVVLNQVDRLSEADQRRALTDLHRLLAADGLPRVEVIATSIVTGDGVAALRARLTRQIADKRAAVQRWEGDLRAAAVDLAEGHGQAPEAVSRSAAERLTRAMGVAAGVGTVVEAVAQAWRLRGGLATGWPVLAWLARFRPDPLRRLHLDRRHGRGRRRQIDPARLSRTSLPAITSVQQARIDTATRDLVDETLGALPRGWRDAVREASRTSRGQLADRLDRAIASTDLDLDRHRAWWQMVRALQWLLVPAVVGGLGWLGLAAVLAYLQLPPLPGIRWGALPAPTVLVLGGVVSGVLVGLLSRVGVEVGARRRRRLAERRLRAAIATVTRELVVAPVDAELARHARVRALLERAAG